MSDHGGEANSADLDELQERIDTSVAHPARRYNYWLGGKDNFAADRASGDAVAAAFPNIRLAAVENRGFLRRSVTFLTEQAGIRQFLDVGTGLPSADNTHEVAQRSAPESRVVYVDNDPLVMVHARALLTSAPDGGVTDYIEADFREPEKILNEAARTLDFGEPIALMLVAILHFIPEDDDPYGIVGRLLSSLAPGSHLVMSHATNDFLDPGTVAGFLSGPAAMSFRSREQFGRFFEGLELVPPGIVATAEWRAENESQPRPTSEDTATYCGVARLP